jgi:hypothetical protein
LSKSLDEEFAEQIGFHQAIVKNDIPAYLKALVELFLTDLLPESFQLYTGSPTGREFLTQILTNGLLLPLFNRLSQPDTIYYLIVLLWESDEKRQEFQERKHSVLSPSNVDVQQPACLSDDLANLIVTVIDNDDHRTHAEHIIYSVTIASTDRTYNSMSGAAYTVYVIQVNSSTTRTNIE